MGLSESAFSSTIYGRIFKSDPDAGQYPVLFADGVTGGIIDSARYGDRDKIVFTYHQVVKRSGIGAWLLPNSTKIMESNPIPKSILEWAVANSDPVSLLFERGPIVLPIMPDGRVLVDDVRFTETICAHCGSPVHGMNYMLFAKAEKNLRYLQTELAKVRHELRLSEMEIERLNREKSAQMGALTGKSLMDVDRMSEKDES